MKMLLDNLKNIAQLELILNIFKFLVFFIIFIILLNNSH